MKNTAKRSTVLNAIAVVDRFGNDRLLTLFESISLSIVRPDGVLFSLAVTLSAEKKNTLMEVWKQTPIHGTSSVHSCKWLFLMVSWSLCCVYISDQTDDPIAAGNSVWALGLRGQPTAHFWVNQSHILIDNSIMNQQFFRLRNRLAEDTWKFWKKIFVFSISKEA